MFPREIEKKIECYFACRQAIFILGARQVGKTSLLKRIMERFPKNQIYYFDLERIADKNILEKGVNNFLNYLQFNGMDLSKMNYIFIDEIHYLDDFSSFIKVLVDHHSDSIKLFLSGSSTTQIKIKFKDSLAGRKYVFHLFPLTFKEFLVFKGKSLIADKLNKRFYECDSDELLFVREELIRLLNEFIIFGGYPEVAKINQISHKIEYLKDIVNSYIIKDIRTMFTIPNINKFNHLIRFLAVNFTNLFAVEPTSREVKLTRETVENYLNILQDTFIIKLLSPYHKNKSTELKKANKVFFLDNGIRNSLIENFNPVEIRTDAGCLLENLIFSQVYKNLSEIGSLYYWRTTKKQEIDFILKRAEKLIPIEVKKAKLRKNHLKIFLNEYKCNKGYIVSLKDEYNKTQNIITLPAYLAN
ncbi:MAG: ATP-binding protein [Candidatus Cloacimonetes bacterium]|nr:ATP-binding protein [Candidatus Cloacimonadota bacterium]